MCSEVWKVYYKSNLRESFYLKAEKEQLCLMLCQMSNVLKLDCSASEEKQFANTFKRFKLFD